MNAVVEFCSDVHMQSGEPLIGSALSGNGYIFLSWPKTSWRFSQYESLGLPPELVAYLKSLQRDRQVLTRLFNPGDADRDQSRCTIFVYPQNLSVRDIPLNDVISVIDAVLEGAPPEVALKADKPILFCCTHGVRDRCCAKYGFAVVKEVRALAAASDLSVYECSHLGGDRFAATAIAFPMGHMYGWLRPDDVANLYAEVSQGRVWAPNYRGSVFLSGVRQLAEAWAHSRLHASADAMIEIGAETTDEQGGAMVEVGIGSARWLLKCVRKEFNPFIDCQKLDASHRGKVMRWCVERATVI